MTRQNPVICKRLHVAFYMHDLSSGGVERMRLTLIAALGARGLDVTLVLGKKRGAMLQFLPADLKIVELGARRTFLAISKLAEFLKRVEPDILVSSLDHNNIAAMLARRLAGSSARLVICQHNALSAEVHSGWKYRVVPWAYWALQRQADAIVAVSHGVAADLARVAGIALQRISVIYNPVVDAGFLERTAAPRHISG